MPRKVISLEIDAEDEDRQGNNGMRIPRIRFTSRGMMLLILVVALATTVVDQRIQLREAAAREEQPRSALYGGMGPAQMARANRIEVDERNVAVEAPAVKDQWPEGIRRATPPPAGR